jgi:hypothetical protein
MRSDYVLLRQNGCIVLILLHTTLAHLVLSVTRDLPVHILRLKLVRDLDVQVAVVLLARPSVKHTGYSLALLDGQDVLEIKYSLFPVRVLCVWAGRELDRLVASSKLNVEPGDDGVNKVAAANFEAVGHVEGKVGDRACVEIEGEDGRGVGDDGLDVDGVDEGLGHGSGLEGGVVEAPDVVPDWRSMSVWVLPGPMADSQLTANLLLLVLAILNTGHEDGSLVGENQTILDQVLVARIQDGIQHGLIEQEVAHPL